MMLKILLCVLGIFCFISLADALECYKCSAFFKDDTSLCSIVDETTPTQTCDKDEPVCTAVGYNHVRDDGSTQYTNIRRCGDTTLCVGAVYQYGEDNIRNCQVCPTDKCNIFPLTDRPKVSTDGSVDVDAGDGESPDMEGGSSIDSSGGASSDGSGGVSVDGSGGASADGSGGASADGSVGASAGGSGGASADGSVGASAGGSGGASADGSGGASADGSWGASV